jgi:multicomponent Na+:H+ antiporter subunit F
MIANDGSILEGVVSLVMAMLGVALLLAFARLVRGPALPDRVVALELISTLAAGLIATHSILVDEPVLLHAAMVVALLGFLGTLAFAYYVQRKGAE